MQSLTKFAADGMLFYIQITITSSNKVLCGVHHG